MGQRLLCGGGSATNPTGGLQAEQRRTEGGSETPVTEHRQREAALERSLLGEIRHAAAKRVPVKQVGGEGIPRGDTGGGKRGRTAKSLNPGSTNRSGGTSRDNAGDTPAQVRYFLQIRLVEQMYLRGLMLSIAKHHSEMTNSTATSFPSLLYGVTGGLTTSRVFGNSRVTCLISYLSIVLDGLSVS